MEALVSHLGRIIMGIGHGAIQQKAAHFTKITYKFHDISL